MKSLSRPTGLKEENKVRYKEDEQGDQPTAWIMLGKKTNKNKVFNCSQFGFFRLVLKTCTPQGPSIVLGLTSYAQI